MASLLDEISADAVRFKAELAAYPRRISEHGRAFLYDHEFRFAMRVRYDDLGEGAPWTYVSYNVLRRSTRG